MAASFDSARKPIAQSERKSFAIELCIIELMREIQNNDLPNGQVIDSLQFIAELMYLTEKEVPEYSEDLKKMMKDFRGVNGYIV